MTDNASGSPARAPGSQPSSNASGCHLSPPAPPSNQPNGTASLDGVQAHYTNGPTTQSPTQAQASTPVHARHQDDNPLSPTSARSHFMPGRWAADVVSPAVVRLRPPAVRPADQGMYAAPAAGASPAASGDSSSHTAPKAGADSCQHHASSDCPTHSSGHSRSAHHHTPVPGAERAGDARGEAEQPAYVPTEGHPALQGGLYLHTPPVPQQPAQYAARPGYPTYDSQRAAFLSMLEQHQVSYPAALMAPPQSLPPVPPLQQMAAMPPALINPLAISPQLQAYLQQLGFAERQSVVQGAPQPPHAVLDPGAAQVPRRVSEHSVMAALSQLPGQVAMGVPTAASLPVLYWPANARPDTAQVTIAPGASGPTLIAPSYASSAPSLVWYPGAGTLAQPPPQHEPTSLPPAYAPGGRAVQTVVPSPEPPVPTSVPQPPLHEGVGESPHRGHTAAAMGLHEPHAGWDAVWPAAPQAVGPVEGGVSAPVLPQPHVTGPVRSSDAHPDYPYDEPSEEEEDAAATLAGLVDTADQRAHTAAHRTALPRVQVPRRVSAGVSVTAVKRRSPPGGSAVWAQHPEVNMGVSVPTQPAQPRSGTSAPRPSDGASRLTPPSAALASPPGHLRIVTQRPAFSAQGVSVGTPTAGDITPHTIGNMRSLPPGELMWLEELTTTDKFFKLCDNCGGGLKMGERPSNGGRDALCTLLDLDAPQEAGVCANCREAREAQGHRLLQIRRSTYHDVVKASDLTSLHVDLSGVQAYSINNARVVFLRPRPSSKPPKGSTMPSRCVLDGRQLMDVGSRYCCLKCKMDVELHGVPPVMSSVPEAEKPAPRSRPSVKTSSTDAHPSTPVSGRKRQRTPATASRLSDVSPAYTAPHQYTPAEAGAPANPFTPQQHASVTPRAHAEGSAVPRSAVTPGASLYHGEHGVLTTLPGRGVPQDPDVRREIQEEAAHIAVNPHAVVGDVINTPAPGNPPFGHPTITTMGPEETVAPRARAGVEGVRQFIHKVSFESTPPVRAATAQARSASSDGRTVTVSGRQGGDVSDSARSTGSIKTGSVKRKLTPVRRSDVE